MKCESCGKKIGLFKGFKLSDATVCDDCIREWGFTKDELKSERYKLKSWSFLRRGKKECDEILDQREYEKTHTKEYKETLELPDEKTIRRIVREAKDITDPDDLYGGWTIKELKEAYNEDRHHIFGWMDFPCELVPEGDRLKVVFDDIEVGTIKSQDFINKKHSAYLIINGGKYRQVEFGVDWDDAENVSDEDDYWFMVKVVYVD